MKQISKFVTRHFKIFKIHHFLLNCCREISQISSKSFGNVQFFQSKTFAEILEWKWKLCQFFAGKYLASFTYSDRNSLTQVTANREKNDIFQPYQIWVLRLSYSTSYSLTHSLKHSLFLALSHTHFLTHSHFFFSYSLSLTLSRSHVPSLSLLLSLSLSLSSYLFHCLRNR